MGVDYVDIHYSPEKLGLRVFRSLDQSEAYEFDLFVVWEREDDGALFYAQDSGCSCPSPFEGVQSVDDLTAIDNRKAFDAFVRELGGWKPYGDPNTGLEVDKLRLTASVLAHLKGNGVVS